MNERQRELDKVLQILQDTITLFTQELEESDRQHQALHKRIEQLTKFLHVQIGALRPPKRNT